MNFKYLTKEILEGKRSYFDYNKLEFNKFCKIFKEYIEAIESDRCIDEIYLDSFLNYNKLKDILEDLGFKNTYYDISGYDGNITAEYEGITIFANAWTFDLRLNIDNLEFLNGIKNTLKGKEWFEEWQ